MNPGSRPETYPSYDAATDTGKEVRLNRYIAMSGKCSRREADEFIVNGDVTVNGEIVTQLGVKILPTDEIRLKGDLLSSEKKVYIILNKPKGFVTSVDDPHADKTVMDIVRNACAERIYPVGRLDKSSVGVLLMTNDGDLTEKLTHPSHNKKKVYQVTLERPLTNMDLQKARDGIDLDDGVIIPDAVDFVKPDNRKEVGIEIHSGRNRIVRRIFEELGYGVHKLDRVYFAGLTKKNLKRGQWRFLTDKELAMLKSGMYE
jgi:23S rRNA pseudouridine2605 synthase